MATIIAFIVVFFVLVLVHEFGHFIFAKRSGILVREFSIGMGPKLIATRRNHTTYTLRLLPLGGYVRMAGWQDEDDEIKPGTQLAIELNSAGVVTRINTSDKTTLQGGIPVQVGKVDLTHDLVIEGYANGNEDELQHWAVDHDATIIEPDGTEVIIAPEDVQFQNASIWKRLLVNFAGPVGIYTMTSQAASGGVMSLVVFAAYLSVNLGVMNLIPIPVLDGGKILLNLIELIRRKPLSQEKEGLVTLIGAGAMVLLMIAVTINDIMRQF